MFSYEAIPTTEDIVINPTKIITQTNLNARGFQTAAEAVIAKLVYPITTQEELSKISGALKSKVEAVIRGVENILKGLPFTAFISGYHLGGLTISSSTRQDRSYIVDSVECQCEGFENHHICYHHSLRPVFQTYVLLLRAHEEFQQAHARVGIELRIVPDVNIMLFGGGTSRSMEQLYDEIMNSPPMSKEDERGS